MATAASGAALAAASTGHTMKVWVKEAGKEAVQLQVKASDTVASLKSQLSLTNVRLRVRQQHMGTTKSLEQCGVADGDIITVLANAGTPQGCNSRGEYLAANRFKAGTTKTSIAWKNLHQETQALVLGESAVVCQAVKQTEM